MRVRALLSETQTFDCIRLASTQGPKRFSFDTGG